MKLNQKGQTSIEYILLLTVSFSLALTFFSKVEKYLVSNPDSLLNLYINSYKTTLSNGDYGAADLAYKRFPLRR